jgi:flavin reductase (DIM6/NTAB) family NADH-FMN oxidoreductase RutF
MIIDPADLDAAQSYKLLIGSILPRPIAWVSTRSVDGVDNLAPVSFFTAAGRKPPRIHLSLQTRSDGVTLKDTFVNIRDTGEFVINIAVLPLADEVHRSAFEFDPVVDEFDALGVAKESRSNATSSTSSPQSTPTTTSCGARSCASISEMISTSTTVE